jgi:HD-GYP domain-containing protein (c-di-GMP phosphodiesterase class II)
MLASHRGRSARHPSEGTTASPFLHARFTRRSAAQCTKKTNPRSRFPPPAWRPPQSCCYAPIVNVEVANALGRIVELKDRSTAAHTWRVSMYAQAVAEAAGVETPRVMNFMLGAVLHDLGKLDVPDSILAKPGPLEPAEYRRMQGHTVAGWERLRRLGVTDPLILDVVRSHHERIDGSGYPDGLAGEQIPRAARWFAVIDGFDAMTSLRPYRDDVGEEAAWNAISELQAKAGSWYEPEAVDVFRGLLEAGRLDSTLEHLNDRQAHLSLVGPLSPDVLELARDALMRSAPPGEDPSRVDRLLSLARAEATGCGSIEEEGLP